MFSIIGVGKFLETDWSEGPKQQLTYGIAVGLYTE